MSLCPNCGNPWLESYEATGKCDACGHVPASGDENEYSPSGSTVDSIAFIRGVAYAVSHPEPETVGMTGGSPIPEPGPEV